MKPGAALLVLGAVVIMTTVFLALSYALNIHDTWVPFLFLTYWGAIEQMSFKKLPACIVGAFVGLAVSYGLQSLPGMIGTAGFAAVLGVILLMVYCLLLGWARIAVNPMSLLFLTVATIPGIQQRPFPPLFEALALGFVFFVGLAAITQWVGRRNQPRS